MPDIAGSIYRAGQSRGNALNRLSGAENVKNTRTSRANALDANTRANALAQREQTTFDQGQRLQMLERIARGAEIASQNPAAGPALVQEMVQMGQLPPGFNADVSAQEWQIIANGAKAALGVPSFQDETGPAGQLMQRDPLTGELKQAAGATISTLPGSLQELNAINVERQSRGEPPLSPEEYLNQRRQTSGDLQAYNQYLASIPEGSQALSLADYKAQTAGSVSGAQARSRTAEERLADQISEGFAAADAIPVINRGLELLEQGVRTGGFEAVKLWAENRLGITGADEGELSSNLGKAVLSQLRATFGAQFTEREGARLQEIEAGFGKSAAVNMRLLRQAKQIAETSARRGMSAARRQGDEETARMIDEAMNRTLEFEQSTPAQTGEQGAVVVIEDDAQFDLLESGTRFQGPDGVVRTKP